MSEKLNIIGNYVLSLIKSVIQNKPALEKPDEISWQEVYIFAKRQNVTNFVYYAIKDFNLDEKDLFPFSEDHKKYTLREAKQELMTQYLLNKFEKAQIKCMPLKGYQIKRFYPIESMRYSVDVDIYFDKGKEQQLDEIMKTSGFELFAEEYDQLIYRKLPIYNYEMHKYIIEHDLLASDYFENIWDRSVLIENKQYCYEMNFVDLYLYTIRHFHKHYIGEGAGIKFILDIFFLKQALNEQQRAEINEKLNDFGLIKFCDIMEELSDIWFTDKHETYDKKFDVISDFLFRNGAFGDGSSGVITRAESDREKKKSFFGKIRSYLKWWFLGLDDMKKFYPVLNKVPVLLPFCWIHKGFKTLVRNPKAIKREFNKAKYAKQVNNVFELSGL